MGLFSRKSKQEKPSKAHFAKAVQQRFYSAGNVTDALFSWTKTPASADDIVNKQLTTLRARSRNLVTTTDFAPQFIRMCETNIIGDNGFRFCGKARNNNGKLDELANDALEYAWKRWGEDGYCDFNGKLDDARFDKLLLRTVAVDGEVFVQKLSGERYGTSFRLIDPENVPLQYNRDRNKTKNLIRFGIEYDRYDRPIAYYIVDEMGSHAHGGKKYTRIKSENITHVFMPVMIGQRRGLPWMSSSMVRMKMLGDFEDFALQNAKTGASKLGILSGEGADEIVDEIDDHGNRIINTDSVGLYYVNSDVDFNTFDTKFPSETSESFIKINLRSLSAGLGVNYSTLASDLEGVNYSSLKHGTTEEREVWKGLQKWFVAEWKRPQYLAWLKFALLIGVEKNNTKLKAEKHEKYKSVEFKGRRWIGPDPLKEATAQANMINAGLKSRTQIIESNGDDPREVFEQLAKETAMLKEMGVPLQVANNILESSNGQKTED